MIHHCFILTSLAICGSAKAHTEPPMPFAQDASGAPAEPLLAGPTISTEAAPRKSLVERDFNGALIRIELRPEFAAIDLLKLTDPQRQVVDSFVFDRQSKISELTFDNLALYQTVQTARQAGAVGSNGARDQSQRELRAKIRELRTIAQPFLTPPLVEQVAKVVPEEQRGEYKTIVSEYIEAFTAETLSERSTGMQAGDEPVRPDNRAQAGAAERFEFNQLMREMARSIAAVVSDRREQLDELVRIVNATPEQASQIQAILRSSGAEPGKPADSQQRADAARKIMDLLSREQREALRNARLREPMSMPH